MIDWIDFDRWAECKAMERPDHVFEVENRDGLAVLTACAPSFEMPPDWQTEPVRFRLVEMPKPRHSSPLPKPSAP